MVQKGRAGPCTQHGPTGGQGFGALQLVTVDWIEPGGQELLVVRKHRPVAVSQQTRKGGKQVVPTQVVPMPRNCPLQAVAEGTSVQMPVAGLQHAPPVGWQGFGLHVPLIRKMNSGAGHWVAGATKHAPVITSQQTPEGGLHGGICAQVWPG